MTKPQQLDFNRRSSTSSAPAVPIKVMPKVADSLKFKNPAYQAGAVAFDAAQEEWRKSLHFAATITAVTGPSVATTPTVIGTGSTPGDPGPSGPTGPAGPAGPNKFLNPDDGLYYQWVPRGGTGGISGQWVPL